MKEKLQNDVTTQKGFASPKVSTCFPGDIRGVSVCADSAGMIGHCQIYTFGHVGKGKATGKQVQYKHMMFTWWLHYAKRFLALPLRI